MPIYDRFAPFYQRGPYVRFSQNLAGTVLPEYLNEMDFHPASLLDIACGEGSFAVSMAIQGCQVVGVDQSHQMIDLAVKRAQQAEVNVDFRVEDMRDLPFKQEFDLATCFFDSMNYLLTVRDLKNAIQCAFEALKPGGLYIFDMNTIYGLAVDWMHQKTYIQNETDDFIEIHRQEFDYENLIATMAVTIFRQRRRLWERIDETHQERGYPVADVEFLLNETGLEIVDRFGSIRKRTELQSTSPRVWFVAQKPPSIHP